MIAFLLIVFEISPVVLVANFGVNNYFYESSINKFKNNHIIIVKRNYACETESGDY